MKKKEINYQLLIRRICLIVLDIICIIAASILALLTRFEFDFSQIPKEFLKVIYKYGPFTIVITLIIFSLFRIYSSLWEYAGIEEVFSLIAACLAAAVAKIVIILFTWSVMPRSWYVLDTIYLMILIGATRVSYRLIRLRRQNRTFPWSKRKKEQRSNLSGAFNNVVSIIPSFLNSSVSAHRIRELVELPKEMHISESEELDPFAEDGFEVLMKDVNFSYVEGTRVITDSYFKACPGEIVALVGPSGEGKTTMIRLILGLIRPQEGEAVIVASNGRKIVLNAETRHFFAYVPQGNTILSGTIAENMRMVKEDATDEEIIEALKIACAWEFVEKLPDTISSALGERGRGLSEGQAQRISIARAVLRNAPILLLDEATSALDVTTERKVLRNIIEQKPNKTCIVTTHRPSVLNMCQRVYRVMETKVTELDEEESSRMAMDF